MSSNVVALTPEDYLSTAQAKMWLGGFRRVPVVQDGDLVGILTDRDIREHLGRLERTKISAAMTEDLVTVTPETTLEEAAQIMLKHKIGGLPVLKAGKIVGMITTSDVVQAFLDVMGASVSGTARIDLVLEEEEHTVADAAKIIGEQGGEILGVGTYRESWGKSPVCYVRFRAADPERATNALR
ncbi:MAG: CBS domain-containing protein [Deltaproteobacteria bacterium]|nr:CBS domain-containing protein [Deltaproteobacteria bacterium]